LNPKGSADAAPAAPKPSEPKWAERLASDPMPNSSLPPAVPHELMIFGNPPGGAEDQPPGKLGGILVAAAGTPGAAHGDAAVLQRRHVERGVAHAGRDQQFQFGQPIDDRF